jgi:hypothetical protein
MDAVGAIVTTYTTALGRIPLQSIVGVEDLLLFFVAASGAAQQHRSNDHWSPELDHPAVPPTVAVEAG